MLCQKQACYGSIQAMYVCYTTFVMQASYAARQNMMHRAAYVNTTQLQLL